MRCADMQHGKCFLFLPAFCWLIKEDALCYLNLHDLKMSHEQKVQVACFWCHNHSLSPLLHVFHFRFCHCFLVSVLLSAPESPESER